MNVYGSYLYIRQKPTHEDKSLAKILQNPSADKYNQWSELRQEQTEMMPTFYPLEFHYHDNLTWYYCQQNSPFLNNSQWPKTWWNLGRNSTTNIITLHFWQELVSC